MAMNSGIKGIKDSANVIVRKMDGTPYIYSDYAIMSELDYKSNKVYAYSKNVKAIAWNTETDATVKMTLEIFELKWLALLAGSEFVEGATELIKREVLKVKSGKVSLKGTPKIGSLSVFLLNDDKKSHGKEQVNGAPTTKENEYSITGKDITFNTTTCPDDTLVVAYYLVDSETTAKTLTLGANAHTINYMVDFDTLMRDTLGNDDFVHIRFPNANPKNEFKITLSSKDITKLEINFDLLADENNNLAYLTYID